MEIYRAGEPDIPWVIKQLREFGDWYGTKLNMFGDEEYALQFVEMVAKSHVLLIASDNGERVGLIAGLFTPHMYNPKIRVLHELWWWVVESKRRCRAASMLLDEFTRIGREKCDWIQFGSVLGKTDVMGRTMARRGYKPAEVMYRMEV